MNDEAAVVVKPVSLSLASACWSGDQRNCFTERRGGESSEGGRSQRGCGNCQHTYYDLRIVKGQDQEVTIRRIRYGQDTYCYDHNHQTDGKTSNC